MAGELDGEVVSVDSRQVYRRLDIGTAKPSAHLRAAVPHHLLDVVEPDEAFDVARYRELARVAVDSVRARGRTVVLCGGSGLYLRALTEGLCAAPPADPEVRAELERRCRADGLGTLYEELRTVDPAAAGRIAPRDAIRITRALEVARLTGRPLSQWQSEHRFDDRPYEVLLFVVSPPSAVLDERIVQRTHQMWRDGLVEETRAVLAAGFAPDLSSLQAIGYRQAQTVLRGEASEAGAVESIRLETRRFAKRQRTWFRRLAGARWLDGGEGLAVVLDQAVRFLDTGG